MANYATLKAAIQAVIYENGNQEITGEVMQATLLTMVNSLGAGYQFMGIATPSTDPGTPDARVFYVAGQKGVYTYFNQIAITKNDFIVLFYDTEWHFATAGLLLPELTKNVVSNNILDLETMISASRHFLRKDNGQPSTSGGYGYTDFIPLPLEGLICNNCYSIAGTYGTRVLYYDSNKNLLANNTQDNRAYWAEGRAYARFNLGDPALFNTGGELEGQNYAIYIGRELKEYDTYEVLNQIGSGGIEDGAITNEKLSDGQITLSKVNFAKIVESKNLYNPALLVTNRWVNINGGLSTVSASYGYFGYVRVKRNTTYHCSNSNGIALSSRTDAYIAFYDNAYRFISSIAANVTSFTTPENAVFVRISVNISRMTDAQLEEGNVRTSYEAYFDPYKIIDPSVISVPNDSVGTNKIKNGAVTQEKIASGVNLPSRPQTFGSFRSNVTALASGDSLQSSNVCVSKNICVVGKIQGAITSVEIGFSRLGTYGRWIEITATEIIVKAGTSGTVQNTYQHGLLLGDNTKIIITRNVTSDTLSVANIKLIDNFGNIFSRDTAWGGVGPAFIYNGNPTGNISVELSVMVGDLTKEIWTFGDSYFSYTDPARWMYYALKWGYLSFLINARGGETASQALTNLQNLLELGFIPSFIVWCMGMNSGSDQNGTVNATWLAVTQQLEQICTERGITLILSTIPTVPTQIHTALNAWVRSSGYRYIDFAAAVESSENNYWRGWGTDNALLSSDEVHPTQHGAVELAMRAFADCPELTKK